MIGRGTAGRTANTPTNRPAVPRTDGIAHPGTADDRYVQASGSAAVPLQRREQFSKPVPGSIPTIVRSYKSAVTLRVNLINGSPGAAVWQRNYYEHVIRNDASLERIQKYIADNPENWDKDDENPNKVAQ